MGRYINSVPMLQSEHRVKGFVWEVSGYGRDGGGVPVLPLGAEYIGGGLAGTILVATQEPRIELPPPLTARAWKLQLHNDAAGTIPFATLDEGGRYAHLESFNVMLEGSDDQPDLQWCTFFCGATSGQERLCKD